MTTILGFYRDNESTAEGHTYEKFLGYSKDMLEASHDYIQWVFPTNELSNFHDAPVLTKEDIEIFKNNEELKNKLIAAFEKMLFFYDFKLENDAVVATKDLPWVLATFNHNYLRITRIITCLRLLGLQKYATMFFNALMHFKTRFSGNTISYWQKAVGSVSIDEAVDRLHKTILQIEDDNIHFIGVGASLDKIYIYCPTDLLPKINHFKEWEGFEVILRESQFGVWCDDA